MLIPNYSIRTILGLTVAVAIVALFVQLALRGHYWAGGLAAAIVGALVTLLVYATAFIGFELIGPPKQRVSRRAAQHVDQPSVGVSDSGEATP